jgi:DNA-binding CsgD family transcriptional regulator
MAVDADGRVRAWNAAAERLLGRAARETLGRPCHEVVDARDVFGNRLCHENCVVQVMARRGEPVKPFEWVAQARQGPALTARVRVSRVVASRAGAYSLVHVVQPQAPSGPTSAFGVPEAAQLSAREIEVLAEVARGLKNRAIAARLGISVATVRNHVQAVIQKLGVHSKLEAVALVLKNGPREPGLPEAG